MEVAIHDRTHNLPIEIRAYVEKKVMGLADHFDLITAAEVEFDRDLKKRREPLHVVKVTLQVAAGFACADIGQPVAHDMQRDLDDVKRLPPLLQVAVELDFGRRDQVAVIGKPNHLLLNISPNLDREIVRSIVNSHFHFGRIFDRSRVIR